MKRIDVLLVEKNLFSSRASAQDALKAGRVFVDGKPILKPSFKIDESEEIQVLKEEHEFVSRGGKKLYYAIQECNIDLKDKVVLDVGASTGGFTDCCLQEGASFVYAIDAGKDQLVDRLKNDIRVQSMEGVNARYLTKDMFDKDIDFICMDVSFISIKLIFDCLMDILNTNYECVFLIKPQFEAGKKYLDKNGIVKDRKVHKRVLDDFIQYFNEKGYCIANLLKCETVGRDGNQEYLIHLKSGIKNRYFDTLNIVKGKE